jgi:FtsP/CotA-like multicopper oxidase with cupredoxin domain
MDAPLQVSLPSEVESVTSPDDTVARSVSLEPFTRRGFLRSAAIAGGGIVAASVAACAPAAAPSWTYGPATPPAAGSPAPSGAPAGSAQPSGEPAATPSMDHSPAPSGSPGSGGVDHDAEALAVVTRFLDGEYEQVEGAGNQPKEPTLDGDVKVFEFTVDEIEHKIDAEKDAVKALGFDGMWPGPRLEVIEGDKVRAIFKNNMHESTGIHFHGQRIPNNMDGVPLITQDPIKPGDSFTYEFTARTVGSHMYHSHHNATDQVGRGLLGAFIVQPSNPAERYDRKYGVSQDIIWISNDSLGGFTINGRGFPATAPIVATLGDRIAIRFMNEGSMMHPWHLHGMPMRVVARDGYTLGSASFLCDTLGVNPGERWDVIIECEEPGAWAFHCHILPHAEGPSGMFGMVTALVVNEPASAAVQLASTVLPGAFPRTAGGPIRSAARAGGSAAFTCRVPA